MGKFTSCSCKIVYWQQYFRKNVDIAEVEVLISGELAVLLLGIKPRSEIIRIYLCVWALW